MRRPGYLGDIEELDLHDVNSGSLMDYVRQLEGKSDIQRRNITVRLFRTLNFEPRIEHFKHRRLLQTFTGSNIIVTLNPDAPGKDLIICGHYDSALTSPGANDDASAIAVMLDLAEKLRVQSSKFGHKIKLIVFDKEEDHWAGGGIGSGAYVEQHGVDDVAGVINMELVGSGDLFVIHSVTRRVRKSPVLKALRQSIAKLGFQHEEVRDIPAIRADYYTFREEGIKDSFCLSVVPGKDRGVLREFVAGSTLVALFKLVTGKIKVPVFFQRYHSPEDKSIYLSEASLRATSKVVREAIKSLGIS